MSELPEKQALRLKKLIAEAEMNLSAAKELLMSIMGEDGVVAPSQSTTPVENIERIIEGVFDGQVMLGPNGKSYPIPANYASKSKLVEGDALKLTITEDGSFMYKQIHHVERKQLIGTLTEHDGAYYVEVGGKEYRVLVASVTYHHITVGDQVAILVPVEDDEATWAAVEAPL